MSIASYRRNVALGVTSREHGTCFPAALEQISPRQSLLPGTYRWYEDFLDELETFTGQAKRKKNPMYVGMYKRLAGELGTSYDQLTFMRIKILHPLEIQ